MKSRKFIVPILAMATVLSTQASADLKFHCDDACPAEMHAIMDTEIAKKLADYDQREAALKMVAAMGAKSEYRSVRVKAIEVLKQAVYNFNADIRIQALEAISSIAKGTGNLQTESSALNVLSSSADSSFVKLSLLTIKNVGDIAVQSPHAEVKRQALAILWDVSWSKNTDKRQAAVTTAVQISNSFAK